jgi:hypothetical protein
MVYYAVQYRTLNGMFVDTDAKERQGKWSRLSDAKTWRRIMHEQSEHEAERRGETSKLVTRIVRVNDAQVWGSRYYLAVID